MFHMVLTQILTTYAKKNGQGALSTKTKISTKKNNPKKKWILSQKQKQRPEFILTVEVRRPWPKTCCAKWLRSLTFDLDGNDTTSERPLGKQTFKVTTRPTIGQRSDSVKFETRQGWGKVFCWFHSWFFQSHLCVASQWKFPIQKKYYEGTRIAKLLTIFWWKHLQNQCIVLFKIFVATCSKEIGANPMECSTNQEPTLMPRLTAKCSHRISKIQSQSKWWVYFGILNAPFLLSAQNWIFGRHSHSFC